jgi:tetratricopeptide (TPR) repeat protein
MLLISNDDRDILVVEDAINARKKLKNLFDALIYNRKLVIPRNVQKVMFTHFDDLLAPDDKTWIRAVHLHIEALTDRTLAHSNYTRVLTMWSSFMMENSNMNEFNCFIDIGQLHKDFAYYYEMSDDYNTREEHLDQAVNNLQQALQCASTDAERVIVEDKLADLWRKKSNGNNKKHRKNVSMVIKFKELSLQRILNLYFANDEAIVPHLEELADLYKLFGEYAVALKYFQWALEVHLQQAEPYYMSIIEICNKMATLYNENKHDAKSACLY